MIFLEELPKNALGKVVKPELLRKLTNGLLVRAAKAETRSYRCEIARLR